MNCPKCQEPMETGQCLIHCSPVGAVLFGVSREHLWFRPEHQQVERVMDSKTERPAHRCFACRIVVIETA
jgi:hypothetical protein